MLQITANNAEAFNEIEQALTEFDENDVFLQYFDCAVQSEADVEGVTVILRNTKKFKKDLNKKKYLISIPTALHIDAFEFLKKYYTKCGKRVPYYSVMIKGSLQVSEVKLVIILTGFNDDSIRIISEDLEPEIDDGNNGNGSESGNNGNGNGCNCPMTSINNRVVKRMMYPPAPLGHGPLDCGVPPHPSHMMFVSPPPPPRPPHFDEDHVCQLPLANCDEESFIVDTLQDN